MGGEGGGARATRARANVCMPCGGALFTRQLMSSETLRKLWTSRSHGYRVFSRKPASGSAVKHELLPNGGGGKIKHRVKMSGVILNIRDVSRRKVLPPSRYRE